MKLSEETKNQRIKESEENRKLLEELQKQMKELREKQEDPKKGRK